jgi:hypothetical protein
MLVAEGSGQSESLGAEEGCISLLKRKAPPDGPAGPEAYSAGCSLRSRQTMRPERLIPSGITRSKPLPLLCGQAPSTSIHCALRCLSGMMCLSVAWIAVLISTVPHLLDDERSADGFRGKPWPMFTDENYYHAAMALLDAHQWDVVSVTSDPTRCLVPAFDGVGRG